MDISSFDRQDDVIRDETKFTMKSSEKKEKGQRDHPGSERVSISPKEYSEMNKCLPNLGGMNPSMQSQAERMSRWRPQKHSEDSRFYKFLKKP